VIAPEQLHLDGVGEPEWETPPGRGDLHDLLRLCERTIVNHMLDRHNGNRTRTAHELGISRQALQQKLARFRDTGTIAAKQSNGGGVGE
jgi:transcriptional regulator with PAS, ATPase and Fis domain